MKKKRVLITGASKGIGRAIALALVEREYTVLGTSRNPESVKADSPGIEFFKLDLAEEQTMTHLADAAGDIDILINNVGASQIGAVEDTPVEKLRELYQVNLFGHIRLIQLFLPRMREGGQGLIMNISSLAGEFAVPFQNGYVSSKFALNGFSWTLRSELWKHGIKVVAVEPNDVKTSITPEVFLPEDSAYKVDVMRMKQNRDRNMDKAPPPETIARHVVKILEMKNPGPFYTVGGMAPFLKFLKWLLPDKIVEALVRKTYGL